MYFKIVFNNKWKIYKVSKLKKYSVLKIKFLQVSYIYSDTHKHDIFKKINNVPID